MNIMLNRNFHNIKPMIDRLISENNKTIKLDLEFNENHNPNKDRFELSYLRGFLEALNKHYPNVNFEYNITYVKHNDFAIDSNKCKKLEEINNYLIDNYNCELLVRRENEVDRSFSFQSVINANRQIDDIVNKVKEAKKSFPDISIFEQFMILYEEVTDFIYKEEERYDQLNASHWISVINSDTIVCTGYASLMQELTKRIFNEKDVLVLENDVDVFDKRRDELISAHANNVIFLKDDKYGINGLFYLDPCWDSIETKEDIKAYSYCCIPLCDILNHKFFEFKFRNVYRYNLQDSYNKFFNLDKTNRILKKIPLIKNLVDTDSNFYEDKTSLHYYIDNYENLDNKSIVPLKAYINAFKIIGKQKGYSGEELETFVKDRIEKSIAKTKYYFDTSKTNSSLSSPIQNDSKQR